MRAEATRTPDLEGTVEISTLLIAMRLKENEGVGGGKRSLVYVASFSCWPKMGYPESSYKGPSGGYLTCERLLRISRASSPLGLARTRAR